MLPPDLLLESADSESFVGRCVFSQDFSLNLADLGSCLWVILGVILPYMVPCGTAVGIFV